MRNFIRVLRCYFWRIILRLDKTHPTFLMGGYSDVSKDFSAGEFSYMGPGCLVGAGVSLGRYSMIGPDVKIIGNDHIFNVVGRPIIFSGRPNFKKTIIGSDVWIGGGAIIRAGVEIGHGAIIGAGAVVTSNVLPGFVVAGVPARFVKYRFSSLEEFECHIEAINGPIMKGKYAD